VSVQNWIKSFGEQIEQIKSNKTIEVVEIDEIHTLYSIKKLLLDLDCS
jgi:hypothetical protein